MSIFIQITLNQNEITPQTAVELISVCPVNIFAQNGPHVHVVAENEDECTLCELCLSITPPGALHIKKLYKDETLVSSGNLLQ